MWDNARGAEVNSFTGSYTRRLTGRHSHWLWYTVPLWEYQSDISDPLTFWLDDYRQLQPDRHILPSDGMSSPPFLWGISGLAQTDFPKSVYFHDSSNRYGGVYINGAFTLCTWRQANQWLYQMVMAEGGTLAQASRIWAGVSIGMPFVWNENRQKENRVADSVMQ